MNMIISVFLLFIKISNEFPLVPLGASYCSYIEYASLQCTVKYESFVYAHTLNNEEDDAPQ